MLIVLGTGILRDPVLAIPSLYCLNIHGGAVPEYRGVYSDFWTLANNDPGAVGSTIFHIDPGVDTGPVALTDRVQMQHWPTLTEIKIENSRVRARLMVTALRQARDGTLPCVPQRPEDARVLAHPVRPAARPRALADPAQPAPGGALRRRRLPRRARSRTERRLGPSPRARPPASGNLTFTSSTVAGGDGRVRKLDYKWVALSNTTLGMLIATLNGSILLIALPDIFRGIRIDPLAPGNTSYLLWLILGFLVVMAVLVVSLGRLGDIYGRVRMFNLGFAVFTVFSILLSITWMHGSAGALWLIAMRVGQGVGGALHLRELERDPHRRVPAGPARARARRQHDGGDLGRVHRARRRRRARADRAGGSSSSSRCRSA